MDMKPEGLSSCEATGEAEGSGLRILRKVFAKAGDLELTGEVYADATNDGLLILDTPLGGRTLYHVPRKQTVQGVKTALTRKANEIISLFETLKEFGLVKSPLIRQETQWGYRLSVSICVFAGRFEPAPYVDAWVLRVHGSDAVQVGLSIAAPNDMAWTHSYVEENESTARENLILQATNFYQSVTRQLVPEDWHFNEEPAH